MDRAGEPTAWHARQRCADCGAPNLRISAMRLERSFARTLYALECLSRTVHTEYSLVKMRLSFSLAAEVPPWQFDEEQPPAPMYWMVWAAAGKREHSRNTVGRRLGRISNPLSGRKAKVSLPNGRCQARVVRQDCPPHPEPQVVHTSS